jgi:hypothetical protein
MSPKVPAVTFVLLLFASTLTGQSQPNITRGSDNPQEITEASDPEIKRIISIAEEVESKASFIENLNSDSVAQLPFGIIKQIGAARYVICIDSMNYKPGGAYLSACASVDFPGSMRKLAFKASHVRFNPSGVISGEQARLYLASNHYIRINACVSLYLKANSQNWVEWDCNGFKAINLSGNFIFHKSKLIPDPSESADSAVTASFSIYTENIHNFIAAVSISPFKIAGLDDWSFKVSNAIVDMSEISNAPSMTFPGGYENPSLVSPGMWTGFYLQQLKIKLPPEISRTGRRTEIEARNLLIENIGITGTVQINNLFHTGEGTMSGWDFSIEELGAGFICNRLVSGHLKGKVELPIVDSSQTLAYTADFQFNPQTKNVDYNFVISPASNLRFNVFNARVNLNSNSSISVSKVNGFFRPSANLNGYISFSENNFNTGNTSLTFQNLSLSTEAPYITNGLFSLTNAGNGRVSCAGYPLNINSITFGISKGAPVLGFDVSMNLTDMINTPLSLSTSIMLRGKIESRQQYYSGETRAAGVTFTKTRWSFDKLSISGAGVDIETEPFTLKGGVEFKNDSIYGSGFFGGLQLSIRKFLDEPIGASVGFGSKQDFRYFFVDVKVPAKYIIPGTPFSLESIIGGMYYHMNPSRSTENDFLSLNASFPNIAGSALTYTPDRTVALGLKAGCTGAFMLNESVFNADLLLDISFNNNGGLNLINLSGNAYSLASIVKRVNAPVRGRLQMSYDVPNKTFDALCQVNISFYSIVNGSGYMKAHADPSGWYLCIGRPSAPNHINVMSLVDMPSYFMIGSQVEAPLGLPPSITNQRNPIQLQSGGAFCAGGRTHAALNKTFGWSFFTVGANFNYDLGFDMMMTNYGENASCGNYDKVGLNGRVAQGNVFLELDGRLRISGHLKFPAGCPNTYQTCVLGVCVDVNVPCLADQDFGFDIFNSTTTAVVSARIPKPLYFSGSLDQEYHILGRVNGSLTYNYEYGVNCNPVSN